MCFAVLAGTCSFCGFGGKMHFGVFDGKCIFAFLTENIFVVFAKKCDLTKKCVLWFWRKNGYYGFGENMHFLRENAFFRF